MRLYGIDPKTDWDPFCARALNDPLPGESHCWGPTIYQQGGQHSGAPYRLAIDPPARFFSIDPDSNCGGVRVLNPTGIENWVPLGRGEIMDMGWPVDHLMLQRYHYTSGPILIWALDLTGVAQPLEGLQRQRTAASPRMFPAKRVGLDAPRVLVALATTPPAPYNGISLGMVGFDARDLWHTIWDALGAQGPNLWVRIEGQVGDTVRVTASTVHLRGDRCWHEPASIVASFNPDPSGAVYHVGTLLPSADVWIVNFEREQPQSGFVQIDSWVNGVYPQQ